MVEVKGNFISEKIVLKESSPLILVGIPAFNEEKTIARVVLESQKYADIIVVCDDGSTDLTGDIAECLGTTVLRHKKNLGYGASIKSILRYAGESSADVVVTLDADGQHDPNEIPNVLKPILDGVADIVIGSRFVDENLSRNMAWYRRVGIKFITKLSNHASKNNRVEDAQSGFRAYNRRAFEALDLSENGMGVSTEILYNAQKKNLKIFEVPSSCEYKDARSTHNPVRHFVGVIMSIVKLVVEERPLLTLGIPGIFSLFVGIFFGVWMLQIYAVEQQIITNIALAAIAFVLIGFFCLSTAITLYAISRLAEKTDRKK